MLYSYFMFVIFSGFMMYGFSTSLLGCAWPEMATDISVSISMLGTLIFINNIFAGLASGVSNIFRRKVGNNFTFVIGLSFFAMSMVFFIFATNIVFMIFAMAAIGFGSGLIDANSNSYVVKYHKAKDVAHLHACWGIGSTMGPLLMRYSFVKTDSYKTGFTYTLILLIILIIVFIGTKIFWENKKKTLSDDIVEKYTISDEDKKSKTTVLDSFKVKFAWIIILCFFLSNAINGTLNNWLATIYVEQRDIPIVNGATAASIFFFSLTLTRIFIGFISEKIKTSNIIKMGYVVTFVGIIMIFINIPNIVLIYLNAAILGIGIAPVIPFLNYNLKELFGEKDLPILIGAVNVAGLLGMAISSGISTFIVKIFGINAVQLLLVICVVLAYIFYSYINRIKEKKSMSSIK